jgi:hypothetical protein
MSVANGIERPTPPRSRSYRVNFSQSGNASSFSSFGLSLIQAQACLVAFVAELRRQMEDRHHQNHAQRIDSLYCFSCEWTLLAAQCCHTGFHQRQTVISSAFCAVAAQRIKQKKKSTRIAAAETERAAQEQ